MNFKKNQSSGWRIFGLREDLRGTKSDAPGGKFSIVISVNARQSPCSFWGIFRFFRCHLSFVDSEKLLGMLTKKNLLIRLITDNSYKASAKTYATKVTKYFIAHSLYSKRSVLKNRI
jgi:hypothetical protein